MRLWRIAARRHAALDGEGSRLYGSRWTPPGRLAIFASSSLALAALERLVHTDSDLPGVDLVKIAIDVPADLQWEEVRDTDLPPDWRVYPPPPALAGVGLAWLESARSAALWIPSVIVPDERNAILNPAHPDFSRISAAPAETFAFDARLVAQPDRR